MDFYLDVLEQFQNENNRLIEESFARTFSEKKDLKLYFENQDQAFTDGKTIVVDPALNGIYCDSDCVSKTEQALGWKGLLDKSPWNILKLVTRGLTVHECLHLLYTDFSINAYCDPSVESENARRVIGNISNIIEDSYIESVAASIYDNVTIYLMFLRYATGFSHKTVPSTAEKNLTGAEQNNKDTQEYSLLIKFLDYMCGVIDFPMFEYALPCEEIKQYVKKTTELFVKGSNASSPQERYEFSKKIYEVIKPLVPKDSQLSVPENLLDDRMFGSRTHNVKSGKLEKGGTKNAVVTTKLFTSLDGSRKNVSVSKDGKGYTIKAGKSGDGIRVNYIISSDRIILQLVDLMNDFKNDEKNLKNLLSFNGLHYVYKSSKYTTAPVHKNIRINENHPAINRSLREQYDSVFEKYRFSIKAWNSKFVQLLQTQVPLREGGYKYGSGIDSRRLGDVKGRFWFRNVQGSGVPELSVLLLIDGSGSMGGKRLQSVKEACVIIHEVLKAQGIEHAVVEQRARFGAPEVDLNILVDFNSREDSKYNLMLLKAEDNTRDALSLFWAEGYMNRKSFCENRLILVLSDGQPCHEYDSYVPPVSVEDTACAVRKIVRRGTEIIAVSLDDADQYKTYDDLKKIYPSLVACNDLNKLTGQLLRQIGRCIG